MRSRLVQMLCCLVGCATGASHARAQTAPTRLYLAPEWRVEGRVYSSVVGGQVFLSVGPAGRIVLTPRWGRGQITALDSAGLLAPWKVKVGGHDEDTEIGWANSVGFVGGRIWIDDSAFRQVALIDERGTVTKSIAYPSWVRPRWSERRQYPFFAGMRPVAVYPDGEMLVIPERPRAFLDTPQFDRKVSHVLRIDADGVILRDVARFDNTQGRLELRGEGNNRRDVLVPFFSRTRLLASPDGARLVVVVPSTTVRDSGSFRVTSLTARGDTAWSRRFPTPAVRITQSVIDSAVRNPGAYGKQTVADVRAMLVKRIPAFRSLVTDAHIGLDHAVWIVMQRRDSAQFRDALVLDSAGTTLGMVRMPDNLKEVQVSASQLWGIEKGSNAIVRFRVQTAPPAITPARPARNGKAGAASSPSKPRA